MRENSRQLQQKHASTGYVRCLVLVHIIHSFLLNPSDASTASKPKIWPVLKITWEFNITLWCFWCPHYGVFLGTLKWHQHFTTARPRWTYTKGKQFQFPSFWHKMETRKDDLFLFYMNKNIIVIFESVNSCQCLMYHCLKSIKACNQSLASFWLNLQLYSTPWDVGVFFQRSVLPS